MQTFLNYLAQLGSDALFGFWVPVILWTAVALPVRAFLQQWRSAHPTVLYACYAALLAALPVGLALSWLLPVVSGGGGTAPVVVVALPEVAAQASGGPGLLTWIHLVGFLTLANVVVAAVFAVRLGVHRARLHLLARLLKVASNGQMQHRARDLAEMLGVKRTVRVASTPEEIVPFTFGFRQPVIVLPASLAAAEHQEMALAHELIHIRRHDYMLQWIEHLVTAVFILHPLVHALRRDIARYREMSCDAELLSSTPFLPGRYGRLLYRFVVAPGTARPLAVGMAVSTNQLKERLLAMTDYRQYSRNAYRRSALTAGLLVLAVAMMSVSCSEMIGIQSSDPVDEAVVQEVDVYPELVGGLAAVMAKLRYPQSAKEEGVEGRVLVQFTVNEEGRVVDPVVVQGAGHGLDEEALRVTRTLEFEPAQKDGRTVKSRMTLPYTFKLPAAEQ